MAEYAGYVASPPINYGEITNELVSNVIAIDQAKREEDRKTQESFDEYFDDNLNTIKDFEYSKSQTVNDMLIAAAQGAKKVMYDAKKTGSKQEVNRTASNLKTSMNDINNAIKASNENFKIIDEAIRKGEVSSMGNIYSDFFSDAMNTKKSSLMVMPDGTIPYVQYDDDGKIASTDSFFDPAVLKSAAPFLDKNIDYDKDLNAWATNVGTYEDEKGRVTTISPKLNPAFPQAKKTKIADLTSTPRNTARFLSSVAGYQGYKDEESRQKLIEDGVSEDKLIEVRLINGIPQPIITDDLTKKAQQIADQQIEQRVGFKTRLDEPRGSGGLGGLGLWFQKEMYKEQKAEEKLMKPLVTKAAIADKIYTSNNTSDWGPLKEAARLRGVKSPSITNTSSGYKILYGIPKGKSKVTEIARFNTPGEIYAYTTGKENVIDALGEYDRAKDYMSEMAPEPQPSANTISLQEATENARKAGMNINEYKVWLKTNRNIDVK
jgi:hypothetical protein